MPDGKLDLFIQTTNDRLARIEAKLEDLIAFKAAMMAEAKMKAIFVSAGVSLLGGVVSIAISMLIH